MIHLKDGMGKGSCRSYGGFNLFAALESCADLLEGFGGHELAAGFTIQEEQHRRLPHPDEPLCPLRLRRRAAGGLPGRGRRHHLLPPSVTLEEVEQLDQLEPYGSGNPRPVFALLGATVDSLQSVGQGRHLKLRLSPRAPPGSTPSSSPSRRSRSAA